MKKINDGKSVVLNDGRELDADLVVLGVGSDVRPNVEPFCDSSSGGLLEKGKDGGIKVNGKFETSQKDAYAIGDVCSFPVRLTGPNENEEHYRMEHVKHARASAAHCARTLIGEKDVPDYKYEPFFYSRVFEQPNSTAQSLGNSTVSEATRRWKPGKSPPSAQLVTSSRNWSRFGSKRPRKNASGASSNPAVPSKTQIAKDLGEKNPVVDVDALAKSATVAEAMSVCAEALKKTSVCIM